MPSPNTIRRRLLLGAVTAAAALTAGLTVWVATGSPPGDDPAAGIPTTAELLRRLEVRRLQAEVDADVDTANEVLADDFTLVPPDSSTLSKADFLRILETGEVDFLSTDVLTDITVRSYGEDAAVLTYPSDMRLRVEGLGRLHHQSWHTVEYEKHAGRWQVHWAQTTGVGFQPPGA